MTTAPAAFAIDEFTVFADVLLISGWARDPRGIASIVLDGVRELGESAIGLTHEDGLSRFRQMMPRGSHGLTDRLVVTYGNGDTGVITHLGFPRGERAINLPYVFRDLLPARGTMLEVGSRARSGVTRRGDVPIGWDYVGLDILDGDNVDVVGDAHELSIVFPDRRFDAFQSFSVFEHLLMPWKVAIELNRVLNVGAVGLIQTHQAWPIHEAPWDFFRFSDQAWAGLFNAATGFEVVEAQMGEPAYMVPKRMHEVTAFGTSHQGYLASNVIVRKIAETSLRWDVRVDEAVSTSYPTLVQNVWAAEDGVDYQRRLRAEWDRD